MAIFFIISGINCSNIIEVDIKVKTHSDIDINKYKKIAVLPFVSEENSVNKEKSDSEDDKGEKIAFFLRRAFFKNKDITVRDTVKTNSIIDGELIDKSLLQDSKKLANIGGELDVNAVITGRYRFYNISEPRRMPVERYSTELHRYITDTITYFHKTYTLSLNIILVDTDTGEIVLDKNYKQSASESHNFGTLVINEAFQDDRIFENLAQKAVLEFAKRIAPHYELEKRLLVK